MNESVEFDAVAWLRKEADECVGDGMPVMASRFRNAADELERLRDIVNKLPKTMDIEMVATEMVATLRQFADSNGSAACLRPIANRLEQLAESDRALSRVWEALGINWYTGKAVWEHVAELKAITNTLEESKRMTDEEHELAREWLRENAPDHVLRYCDDLTCR